VEERHGETERVKAGRGGQISTGALLALHRDGQGIKF